MPVGTVLCCTVIMTDMTDTDMTDRTYRRSWQRTMTLSHLSHLYYVTLRELRVVAGLVSWNSTTTTFAGHRVPILRKVHCCSFSAITVMLQKDHHYHH